MGTSTKRRYSITEKEGKIIKSSLLFTYGVLENLLNEEIGAVVDKEYLNAIAETWHALASYGWSKK